MPISNIAFNCISMTARAAFKFAESFHEDYKDLKSVKTNDLWNKIEPLLVKSFGVIEVDLSLVNIEPVMIEEQIQESIQTEVDILPIRNKNNPGDEIFVEDINTLLADDQWNKNTENIFTDAGIEFVGVELIPITKTTAEILTSTTLSTTSLDEKIATNRPTTRSNSEINTTSISNTIMDPNIITIWAVFKFDESFNITFHQENDEVKSLESNQFWILIKPLLETIFDDIEVNLTVIDVQQIDSVQERNQSIKMKIGIQPIRNRINSTDKISVEDIISLLESDEVKNLFLNNKIDFLGVDPIISATLSTSTSISNTSTSNNASLSDTILVSTTDTKPTTESTSRTDIEQTTELVSRANTEAMTEVASTAGTKQIITIWAVFKFDASFSFTFHQQNDEVTKSESNQFWNIIRPLLENIFAGIEVNLTLIHIQRIGLGEEHQSIKMKLGIQPIRNRINTTDTISVEDIITLLENDEVKNVFLKNKIEFLGVDYASPSDAVLFSTTGTETKTEHVSTTDSQPTTEPASTTDTEQMIVFFTKTNTEPTIEGVQITGTKQIITIWAVFKFAKSLNFTFHQQNESNQFWSIIKPLLQSSFDDIEVNLTLIDIQQIDLEQDGNHSIKMKIGIQSIRNRINPTGTISVEEVISLLENSEVQNMFLYNMIEFVGVDMIISDMLLTSTSPSDAVFVSTTGTETTHTGATTGLVSSANTKPMAEVASTTGTKQMITIWAVFKFTKFWNITFHQQNEEVQIMESNHFWSFIEPLLRTILVDIEVNLTMIKIQQIDLEQEGHQSIKVKIGIQPIQNKINPTEPISADEIISFLENDEVKNVFLNNKIEFLSVDLVNASPSDAVLVSTAGTETQTVRNPTADTQPTTEFSSGTKTEPTTELVSTTYTEPTTEIATSPTIAAPTVPATNTKVLKTTTAAENTIVADTTTTTAVVTSSDTITSTITTTLSISTMAETTATSVTTTALISTAVTTTTLATSIPAITTTAALSYSWVEWGEWSSFMPPCHDASSTQATIFQDDIYIPTRYRFRSCVSSAETTVFYSSACGDVSDRVETEEENPISQCESRFENNDSSLYETKVIVSFKVQIYEKWSTDLTETDSKYFIYLSQLYSRAFIPTLQKIQKTGIDSDSPSLSSLNSSWKMFFATVRVTSFNKATDTELSRRKRQAIEAADEEIRSEIEAKLEAVFNTLVDADEENTSGVTSDAEEELKEALKTAVEEETKAETENKLTDFNSFKENDRNYVSDVKADQAELEDVILAEDKTTTESTKTSTTKKNNNYYDYTRSTYHKNQRINHDYNRHFDN